MANKKTKYSKPSKKSHGLKYDARFDFSKKMFVIMKGRKIIGDKKFKNVYETIEEILNM